MSLRSIGAVFAGVLVLGCGLRGSIPAPRTPLSRTPADALPPPPDEPLPSAPFRLRLVRRSLSNGLRIVLSRGEPNGLVSVVFVSGATPAFDRGVDPTLTRWVARELFRAVGEGDGRADDPMEAEMFSPIVEALPEGIRISERLPAEELDRYLTLLERSLSSARFRPADLRPRRAAALDRLRHHALTTDGRLEDRLGALLYAEHDPRGRTLDARVESLEGLGVEALQRRHAQLADPRRAAIVVTGDIDPAAVLPRIGQRFSGWADSGAGPTPVPASYRTRGPRLLLVEEPLVRSFIKIVDRAPPFPDPDYPAFLVIEQLLGRMFGAHLNLEMRERATVSYGAHAAFTSSAIDGRIELVSAVSPSRTRGVVAQFLAELGRVRGDGDGSLEPLELSLAKTRARETLLSTLDTTYGLARAMGRRVLAGQEPGAMGPILRAIDALDAEAVQAAARRWLRPERAVIVVVAAPDVLSDVRGLGLGGDVYSD